jgi:hypothetical protein
MKYLFLIIVILHGLIHVLGFLKSLGYAIPQLPAINKLTGIVWLVASFVMVATAILYIADNALWLLTGTIAILVSQVLIFLSWQEAKYGTLPNSIILIVVFVGCALWFFNHQVEKEIQVMLAQEAHSEKPAEKIITENMITRYPVPVQRWLRYSGVVGKEIVRTVYVTQKGKMRLNPGQKQWFTSCSQQYFTVTLPAFIWKVSMNIYLLPVIGRDMFVDGKGEMKIMLMGLIPIAIAGNDPKIHQSALQRFLGEISWFPQAALMPYIRWEAIDESSARATITYRGVTGSAVFHFNTKGELVKFVAMRYKDINDEKPTEWVATVKGYGEFNGIKIPTSFDATWMLKEGPFTWFRFDIFDVRYQ